MKHHITKTIALCLIFALGSICQSLYAQESVSQSPAEKKQLTDAELLVQKLLDKKSLHETNTIFWMQLRHLPVARRDEALQTIIKSDNEEAIEYAVRLSLEFGRPKMGRLVAEHILDWGGVARHGSLSDIMVVVRLGRRDAEFFEAPRQVLSAIVKKGQMRNRMAKEKSEQSQEESQWEGSDAAVMLLRYSGVASDQVLLEKVVTLDPQSVPLWLALATYGKLRPVEQAIAKQTFKNEKLPDFSRLSAAVALAPTDEQASAYVTAKFRRILLTWGRRDTGSMMLEMGKALASTNPKEHEKLMQLVNLKLAEMGTLRTLRYLHSPDAENLIFAAATAHEFGVKNFGALVAAERFPKHFLKILDRKRYPDQYENLCGVLALWHPELKRQLLKKLSAKKLDEAVKRLQSGSVSIVSNDFI